MKKVFLMAAAGLMSVTASAQYPDLTDEAKKLIAEQKAQWKAHADSAWEAAFPIVVKEAKEGRPYVPWASRPYDLRRAACGFEYLLRQFDFLLQQVDGSWACRIVVVDLTFFFRVVTCA